MRTTLPRAHLPRRPMRLCPLSHLISGYTTAEVCSTDYSTPDVYSTEYVTATVCSTEYVTVEVCSSEQSQRSTENVTAELEEEEARSIMMPTPSEIPSIPPVAGSDYGGEEFSGESAGGEDIGERGIDAADIPLPRSTPSSSIISSISSL